jgi:hypothetical protein
MLNRTRRAVVILTIVHLMPTQASAQVRITQRPASQSLLSPLVPAMLNCSLVKVRRPSAIDREVTSVFSITLGDTPSKFRTISAGLDSSGSLRSYSESVSGSVNGEGVLAEHVQFRRGFDGRELGQYSRTVSETINNKPVIGERNREGKPGSSPVTPAERAAILANADVFIRTCVTSGRK